KLCTCTTVFPGHPSLTPFFSAIFAKASQARANSAPSASPVSPVRLFNRCVHLSRSGRLGAPSGPGPPLGEKGEAARPLGPLGVPEWAQRSQIGRASCRERGGS